MESGRYEIPIAGEWSLEDLYVFPRAYEQCYFMYLALLPDAWEFEEERITRAYEAFPWQGGFSAVGFYNHLKWAVPKKKRPRVRRIEYSSPGLIELGLIVAVAAAIERIVRSLCNSAKNINATYTEIYRDLQDRKLLKIKTENEIRRLSASECRVIDTHVKTIAQVLDVDPKALNDKTGSSYKSLKILLSLFRRMKRLSEFQKKGMINL
jgi:hypothetical protein